MRTLAFFVALVFVAGACAPAAPPAVERSPTGTDAPQPTPTPTPAADVPPAEMARVLAAGWAPMGTLHYVVEIAREDGGPSRLVAVPATGGAATEIASIGRHRGWDLRRDGTALAVALETGSGSRIAVLDLRGGAAAYVTPAGNGDRSPVWSPDGLLLYFGRSDAAGTDLGLFRVGARGGTAARIREGLGPGISLPRTVTTDQRFLVWSGQGLSETVRVLDLVTGTDRVLAAEPARVAAVRGPRPRILVERLSLGGDGTGLLVWDDRAPEVEARAVVAPGTATYGAAWAPGDGALVVAVAQRGGPVLLTMDRNGGARQIIPGTSGATWPVWSGAGIAYVHAPRAALQELRAIRPEPGAAPTTLYLAPEPIRRLVVVAP